jgi:hypothetical protein
MIINAIIIKNIFYFIFQNIKTTKLNEEEGKKVNNKNNNNNDNHSFKLIPNITRK